MHRQATSGAELYAVLLCALLGGVSVACKSTSQEPLSTGTETHDEPASSAPDASSDSSVLENASSAGDAALIASAPAPSDTGPLPSESVAPELGLDAGVVAPIASGPAQVTDASAPDVAASSSSAVFDALDASAVVATDSAPPASGVQDAAAADAAATSTRPAPETLRAACAEYCAGVAALECGGGGTCFPDCLATIDTGLPLCDDTSVLLAECWAAAPAESTRCDAGHFDMPASVCSEPAGALRDCALDNAPNPELELACAELCAHEGEICEPEIGCDVRCLETYRRGAGRCGLDKVEAYFDCLIAKPIDVWECSGGRALTQECLDELRQTCLSALPG